jgi:glycosyltransferase involved in cell wall biosynthesis
MVDVSVLMPIYKGEQHLKEAIDSVLNQSFKNFEFVIINDASPDNSEKIILSYNDIRIVYKKHEHNKGLVGALNSGLEICKGKYIARMDQDDIADLNRLQLQFDFMEKNPDYILLGGQATIIDSKDKLQNPISDEGIRAKLVFATSFVHPTVMFRKAMLDKNNLSYRENYKHAEDYGFWIDLASHGKMANLPETCLYYRRHEAQYTVVFNEDMVKMVKIIRAKYLNNNSIEMISTDLNLLEIITERRIEYANEKLIKDIGGFLSRLSSYFKNSPIDEFEVKKIASQIWNKTCSARMNLGFPIYSLYISNSLAFSKFDLKTHLHFLKSDLIRK